MARGPISDIHTRGYVRARSALPRRRELDAPDRFVSFYRILIVVDKEGVVRARIEGQRRGGTLEIWGLFFRAEEVGAGETLPVPVIVLEAVEVCGRSGRERFARTDNGKKVDMQSYGIDASFIVLM